MTAVLAIGGYLTAVCIAVWLIGVLTGGDPSTEQRARERGYRSPGTVETTGETYVAEGVSRSSAASR